MPLSESYMKENSKFQALNNMKKQSVISSQRLANG